MQKVVSQQEKVSKYLFPDGSETSIKFVSSCDTIKCPNTGKIVPNNSNRNKFSVFLSSSSGCALKCKFCHLTIKKAIYRPIKDLNNQISAIGQEFLSHPEMRDMYLKLCWMGMGEDFLFYPEKFASFTYDLAHSIISLRKAKGIDGVDISTVLPLGFKKSFLDSLLSLQERLKEFPLNPDKSSVNSLNGYKDEDRSIVRLFYSLHSTNNPLRDHLIPNSVSLYEALPFLKTVKDSGINVIFHYLILDGINDSVNAIEDVPRFLDRFHLKDCEFRILRYNPAEDPEGKISFKESRHFEDRVEFLQRNLPRVKVQISTGTDVLAACGQFYAQVRK